MQNYNCNVHFILTKTHFKVAVVYWSIHMQIVPIIIAEQSIIPDELWSGQQKDCAKPMKGPKRTQSICRKQQKVPTNTDQMVCGHYKGLWPVGTGIINPVLGQSSRATVNLLRTTVRPPRVLLVEESGQGEREGGSRMGRQCLGGYYLPCRTGTPRASLS